MATAAGVANEPNRNTQGFDPELTMKHMRLSTIRTMNDRDQHVSMVWNHSTNTPGAVGAQPDSYCPEIDKWGEDPTMNAVRFLSKAIRERVVKMCEDGTLRDGELDLKCVVVLQSIPESLQTKVMDHLDNDRAFFLNARSKSGFIISTCDKAKRGELDVRGFGAVDPWKSLLRIKAIPKRREFVELVDEKKWVADVGEKISSIRVIQRIPAAVATRNGEKNVAKRSPKIIELSGESLRMSMTVRQLKESLREETGWRVLVMRLKHQTMGVLLNKHTLGWYNFRPEGTKLKLTLKRRGGLRVNRSSRPHRNARLEMELR